MPTLQVLQDVQTRLERGGGGGTDRKQRGRNEGGMEKCASLNNIETTMSVIYGCVSTSSKVAVHHHKENSMNHSY